MTYVSGGQVIEKRSWLRLSIVPDIFWGIIGIFQLFFSTFFGGEAPKANHRPSARRGGGGGGGSGGGGGPGGPRRPIGRLQPATSIPAGRS